MNAQAVLDTDAAMVLGMASTAMPFAGSPEAEAERWLRILRVHGAAGSALQALGVSEAPLESPRQGAGGEQGDAGEENGHDVVAAVTEAAVQVARERGAHMVGTSDVLVGAMRVYGADFDRVLWAHGTDRGEVLERLATHNPAASPGAHTPD
jgi:hypothetical protein